MGQTTPLLREKPPRLHGLGVNEHTSLIAFCRKDSLPVIKAELQNARGITQLRQLHFHVCVITQIQRDHAFDGGLHQKRGEALLDDFRSDHASRLQKFCAPDLHPLNIYPVVDMTEKVNMKGVDFLIKGYFLHGRNIRLLFKLELKTGLCFTYSPILLLPCFSEPIKTDDFIVKPTYGLQFLDANRYFTQSFDPTD